MTATELAEVFRKLCALRPELAERFGQLRDDLFREVFPIMRPLTESEMAEVHKQAQSYCDRIASVIRGLAFLAGHDFPELLPRFTRVADDAANVLLDYKASLTARAENENASKATTFPARITEDDDTVKLEGAQPAGRKLLRHVVAALAEDERQKVERAMSSE